MGLKNHIGKFRIFRNCSLSVMLLFLSLMIIFSGCGINLETETENKNYSCLDTNPLPEIVTAESLLDDIGYDSFFSAGDKEIGYSESDDIQINLSGEQIFCTSSSVQIEGSQATITEEGNYIISGNLQNGQINVDTDNDKNVRIVLNGVNITNDYMAPINIQQAKKVLITLAENTENTLNNSCTGTNEKDSRDAIFSNSCLTINGLGKLNAVSKGGNGIFSSSNVLITGGNICIEADICGILGVNSVRISNTNMQINSKVDGINASNEGGNNVKFGFVYISDGYFDINCGSKGINAKSSVVIDGGTFDINTSHEYSFVDEINENINNNIYGEACTDEELSALYAGTDISISGGNFNISSSGNALIAGYSVSLTGGSYNINSQNDAIASECAVVVEKANINIEECFRGIYSGKVLIKDGSIKINSCDDGINAGGGADEETIIDNDTSECFVELTGGRVVLNSCGDGINSSDKILVSGGSLSVVSESKENNFIFHFGESFAIIGGTVFGAGSFCTDTKNIDIQQPLIIADVENIEPKSRAELIDSSGQTVISESIEKQNIDSIFITDSGLENNKVYTLSFGDSSISVCAKEL